MRTLKFTIFPFLFVLLLPGTIGSAQDEIPVFRSGVQLVELTVSVRDNNGKPVPGLTAADFILLENGTERKIDLFVEPITPESRAAAESTLPPGVYSNAPELNRNSRGIVMVLVDSLNTCVTDQMLAKQQIIDFLLDLPPNQRIALYSIGMQFRVLHDFTSEPEPLIERLKEMPLPTSENALFQAGDLTGTIIRDGRIDTFAQARDFEKALWSWFKDRRTLNDFALYDQRVRNSIAAIEGIARNVEGLPGKKTLLWLSGGFQEFVGQLDPSARPGARPGMPPPELAREQFNTAEAFQSPCRGEPRGAHHLCDRQPRPHARRADLSPSACDGIHAGVTLLNQQVLKDAAAATRGPGHSQYQRHPRSTPKRPERNREHLYPRFLRGRLGRRHTGTKAPRRRAEQSHRRRLRRPPPGSPRP
ncbi:MAG: VWA domain-containing protein [Bryobacteraceae bacterium]